MVETPHITLTLQNLTIVSPHHLRIQLVSVENSIFDQQLQICSWESAVGIMKILFLTCRFLKLWM